MKWIAALVVLVALAAAGPGVWWWTHRPTPQTKYYGVSSTDGKAEVQYKLGTPKEVLGPPETMGDYAGSRPVYFVDGDPMKNKNALPTGTDFRSFDAWDYPNTADSGGYITVEFTKAGRVYGVGCFSSTKAPGSCNPVLGVHIGDSESSVVSRLGKPTEEKLEGPSKTARYKARNLALLYTQQTLYMITVGPFGAAH